MKQYRKKPVVIEAIQITDATFSNEHPNPEHIPGLIYNPVTKTVHIQTLEGTMVGSIGDWIIKGIKGEYYPCKNDIFVALYDVV